jgi:hypothetical protein
VAVEVKTKRVVKNTFVWRGGVGAGGGWRDSVVFKKVPRLSPLFFLIFRL